MRHGFRISIHALLAESDINRAIHGLRCLIFLSTLSLRRATLDASMSINPNPGFLSTLSLRRATNTSIAGRITSNDFYPRSPCGERPPPAPQSKSSITISIHALLAESDLGTVITYNTVANFYPRSPCGERPFHRIQRKNHHYFYPRSPCGERRLQSTDINGRGGISIHALLAESDTIFAVRPYDAPIFLSTLSLRRATD